MLKSLVALLLCFACCFSSMRADTAATGSLIGHVTDLGSRLSLSGARISVTGTTLEAFTNQQGDYRLADVPAGQVNVVITYVGYNPQTLPATVTAGQVVRVDASFGEAVVVLNAMSVTSDVVGTARAINQQRAAPAPLEHRRF